MIQMMNGFEVKRLGLVAAVLIVLGISIVLLPTSVDVKGEWETGSFEDAIEIARVPDHVDDRPPLNMEEMSITISSRTEQIINGAAISMTWSYQGQRSPEGGYGFTKIDQNTWETTINGYPGGYTINYNIIAYDEKNHPLTSPTYSYTVIENESFIGTDFEIVLSGLRASTLILIGGLTDVCVHYTFADAHQRDFYVRVVTDCVGGSSTYRHDAALDAMEYLQAGAMRTTEEIITAFSDMCPPELSNPALEGAAR